MIENQPAGQHKMLEESLCHVMMDKALIASLLLLDKVKLERQNHALVTRDGDGKISDNGE